ncbi:recombinase family protein [Paraburkholderia sp. BCC1876]|uniref:recombinase family protein n=1 Tax=Paraburkholderia sp. BCC1876 TaxID=2676303 RepID=UPI001591E0BC|nr:recombinase family protein [Paraburkholderia sp. BCC1876]
MTTKARVYSYLRFSDPKQAAGSSVERQTEYARRWAAEHGLELDDTLSMRDEGLSAYHQVHVKNGALGVFLRAIEDGKVPTGSVLVVEGLDRLSRAEPILAQGQLSSIIGAGIRVITASDGREYSREVLKKDPMGLVYSLLTMIRAHEESDTKSKRVKAAIRRQCQGWVAGTWRGIIRNGKDPHWTQAVDGRFELMPERAAAIRLMIQMFLDGHGAVRTVRELTERGLSMSANGNNGATQLYKIIRNRALVGEKTLEVDGEEFRLEGYYPALLSPEQFSELQYAADQRGTRKGKGEIPGILTGLGITRCVYCGTAVVAQNLMGRKRKADGRPQDGHRRLICVGYSHNTGCPVGGSCSVVPVERALMAYCSDQMNLTRLTSGDGDEVARAARLAQARAQAAETERQIEKVTDALLSDPDGAPAAFVRRARELEDRLKVERNTIDQLEHELAASSTATPAAAQAWAELAEGVEALDYDARMKVRQLVADTFAHIGLIRRGLSGVEGRIALELVGKRGVTRLIEFDSKTGELYGLQDVPHPPGFAMPS